MEHREYMKNYRTKNKEKINASQREWYSKNKDKVKKYKQANRDKLNAKRREYYATHKEQIDKIMQRYWLKKIAQEQDKEQGITAT